MRISAGSEKIVIRTPAKLNLFLEVTGRRPDGYHNLDTVMVPISLLDELTAEPADELTLDVKTPQSLATETKSLPDCGLIDAAWNIPVTADNLVIKAFEQVRRILGIRSGAKVTLSKQIPAQAGLGGGSSDAAAAVCAALLMWSCWDRVLASRVCAALGSDTNFFLGTSAGTGIAHATGRGEIIELLEHRPVLEFLVLNPPAGCSTRQVFETLTKSEKTRNSEKIIAACESGQAEKIGAELFNALQSPAASITSWVNTQLDLLIDHGHKCAIMTGSGSSCFAILEEQKKVNQTIEAARALGISRAYKVGTWYAPSIESQLLPPDNAVNEFTL
ncbi:MAG: 4-(cytidine 5'-diphospho)-2-C-methyl-D-erythritol kinase [Planctomycetales bacterium]|nr:4-(cytidine 5'-diphospho)-2-C-methyl-D-erythritol kinase [Planctomycetales bacterium]